MLLPPRRVVNSSWCPLPLIPPVTEGLPGAVAHAAGPLALQPGPSLQGPFLLWTLLKGDKVLYTWYVG